MGIYHEFRPFFFKVLISAFVLVNLTVLSWLIIKNVTYGKSEYITPEYQAQRASLYEEIKPTMDRSEIDLIVDRIKQLSS